MPLANARADAPAAKPSGGQALNVHIPAPRRAQAATPANPRAAAHASAAASTQPAGGPLRHRAGGGSA
eukprot:14336824-Alexandrium_andersonii.AAC.1